MFFRSPPLAAVLLLAACEEGLPVDTDPHVQVDDPWCASNRWYPDEDGDGYGDRDREDMGCLAPDVGWIPTGGDCDDARDDVNPGVTDIPDREDEDCDGVPDDGSTWADDDGDGFCEGGDDGSEACSDGSEPGDCDDARGTHHPGATELCDGEDGDCDGTLAAFELDVDGDGVNACTDCLDDDETRYPGATERCDGRDDDCDGRVDDLDADGDGFFGCATSAYLLDVLIVVDDSQGLTDEHDKLGQTFVPTMIDTMNGRGLDWRVGVLPASVPLLAGATLDHVTDDVAAKLAAQVKVGQRGDPNERPLANLTAFLDSASGRGWRRPGAPLAVWVVSFDDDHTSTTLPQVRDLAIGDLPPAAFKLSTLGGGWRGCATASASYRPTPRLSAFARDSGGLGADACRLTWATGGAWIPFAARDCDDADALVNPRAIEVCNGVDDDCDDDIDGDADEDGQSVCDGDCDDRDPLTYAGAPEACDGRDNGCDTLVPDDERDDDGDGVRACAGDCDDTRDDVGPRAPEACGDGVDQNCDGGDDTVSDRSDLDGDGWSACAGDCDDDDFRAFPMAPEHPFDGHDNDCDLAVDGDDDEVLTPYASVADETMLQLQSTGTLFELCGGAYDAVSMSANGFALAGIVRRFDQTPSVGELGRNAPFVAAGWVDLDPTAWTESTLFPDHGAPAPLWSILRDGGVTLVWDHVPVKAEVGTGYVTSLTHLGRETLDVTVLESTPDRAVLVGVGCAVGDTTVLPTGETPACVDLADPISAVWLGQSKLPFAASTACQP